MDQLYDEILNYTYNHKFISIRQLQLKYRIGYNRSLRIIMLLEQEKIIKLIKKIIK